MSKRLPSIGDQLAARAVAYVDRRGGAGLRRGGRGRGGAGKTKPLPFDPTKVYGLTGFGAGNSYATPANGGEAGIASGFGSITLHYVEKIPTGAQTVFGRRTTGQGYSAAIDQTAPGYIYTLAADGSAASVGSRLTTGLALAASDVGKILPVVQFHGGTQIGTMGWDGTLQKATAITGYTAAGAGTTQTLGTTGIDVALAPFAGLTYRGTPTAGQLRAVLAAARVLGDVPGKAAAEALMPVRSGARGMSATNYFQTAVSAGIAGVGTGFHVIGRVRVESLSGTEVYFGRDNLSNGGWRLGRSGTALTATFTNVSGTQVNATSYTLPSTGVYHVALQHTGTAIQLWVNGAQVGADFAIAGFTPLAARMIVANVNATYAAATMAMFELSGGHSVLTAAEIQQSAATDSTGLQTIAGKTEHLWRFHDDIVANGNAIPATILDRVGTDHLSTVGTPTVATYGATVTHRWSLREELAKPNLIVVDGAAAPASIADTVTNAAGDLMSKTGSPVVRVINPATYPRTSYGVMGFATASTLQSAPGAGFRGSGSGFTVRCPVTFWSLTGNEYFATCAPSSGYRGWMLTRNAATLTLIVGNGSAAVPSTKALTSADLGTQRLVHLVYDGTAIEGFLDGASFGKTTGAFVAALAAEPMVIGGLSITAVLPAPAEIVYGLAGADYVATAAEIAADYATWKAAGALADMPGKPDANRYDFTKDVIANGGPSAGVPAQALDRVGTAHLTRVGTGLVISPRTERLYSYETSPIFRGVDGFTSVSYYQSSFDDTTVTNTSFYNAYLIYMPALTQAAYILAGGSAASALNTGWDLRINANNASVNWGLGDGSAFSFSGNAIAATGKLGLFVSVWDQTALRQRLYAGRAEVGLGTSRSGYTQPPAGSKIGLGRSARDPTAPGGAHPLIGFAQGVGLPTLAQVQALFDAVQATESMQGIPGMTNVLVDFTLDAASGALPSTLANRAGAGSFALVGSAPFVSSFNARAWAW